VATPRSSIDITRPTTNALEIQNLSKAYQIPVIQDLTLAVQQSGLVCLLGPNGCGKTTLLRVLAGIESPSQRHIRFNGQAVELSSNHDHYISVVFQEPRLLPWKSLLDYVVLGLSARRAARRGPADCSALAATRGGHRL